MVSRRFGRYSFLYISLHILRGYVYSFCKILHRLCLFKGLRFILEFRVPIFSSSISLNHSKSEIITLTIFLVEMFHNYSFKEWISLKKKSSAPEFIGHKLAFAAIVTNYSICGDRGVRNLGRDFHFES